MYKRCLNCDTVVEVPNGVEPINCTICYGVRLHTETDPPPISYHKAPCPSAAAPSPYNSSPPRPRPDHGRKKAVICGILYKNSEEDYKLKGCINDAEAIKSLLINKFKFPESSIIMLTEEGNNPNTLPTKQNIRKALHWLVQGCQNGDSLVFYYAGHGSQEEDCSRDEVDGYDETIWPLDYVENGKIFDNEINATIVRPLPPGVKLHAIIDSCNSGTILDLRYLFKTIRDGKYGWDDHSPPSGIYKGTSGGEVFCFSGCADGQTAREIKKRKRIFRRIDRGAMTSSFVGAINDRGQGNKYGTILNYMRDKFDGGTSRFGTSRSVKNPQESNNPAEEKQVPQLTSSIKFNVYTKPFSL